MLLLMLLGVGSQTGPQRAYAALSFSLVDGSVLDFSLVNSGDVAISGVDSAEGSVS